jgi:DNA-binding response OmpR family regulator
LRLDDPRAEAPLLVADDEPVHRRVIVEALESAGMATLQAANGEQALDLLSRHRVSALVLDSVMPGLGGIEVLEALRGRQSAHTLPILLVTGRTGLSERIRGLEAGTDDYLSKPVQPSELVARVKARLRGQIAWARVLEHQLRDRAALTRLRRCAASRARPHLS